MPAGEAALSAAGQESRRRYRCRPPGRKAGSTNHFQVQLEGEGTSAASRTHKPTFLYCTPPLHYLSTSLATNCLLQCSLTSRIPSPHYRSMRLHKAAPPRASSPPSAPSKQSNKASLLSLCSFASSLLLLLVAHLSFLATPPKTTLILNLSPNITPNTPIVAYYASDITRIAHQLLRDTIIPHFSFNDGLRRSL